MPTTAFWKALYTSGHDAARLIDAGDGWLLIGTAVYLHDGMPCALNYRLELTADWITTRGSIEGHVGGHLVHHEVENGREGWLLNGERQGQLAGVLDLDFGFTPATNFAQLRRMNLAIGEKAEIIVAWMDIDSRKLKPLPQIYERKSDLSYDYNSPQGPYRATLEVQESGFVKLYPDLWLAEEGPSPRS